jgi:hypothetical protein
MGRDRCQLFTAGASELFDLASLDEDTKQVPHSSSAAHVLALTTQQRLHHQTIARAPYLYLECAFLSFTEDLLLDLARASREQSKVPSRRLVHPNSFVELTPFPTHIASGSA